MEGEGSGAHRPRHYLTCCQGNSDKFYEITANDGNLVVCRYGRNGTAGVTTKKQFSSEAEREAFINKTLAEKLKKGYQEVRTEVPNTDSKPPVNISSSSSSSASSSASVSQIECENSSENSNHNVHPRAVDLLGPSCQVIGNYDVELRLEDRFYHIQLIEAASKFVVFSCWGTQKHDNTEAGLFHSHTSFKDLEEAQEEFRTLFYQKTLNRWQESDQNLTNFKPQRLHFAPKRKVISQACKPIEDIHAQNWNGTNYLLSLTVGERDDVLKDIAYVDTPRRYAIEKFLGESESYALNYNEVYVLNFNDMYDKLTTSLLKAIKLPNPTDLRNGDIIQFGHYREIGSYRVIWLRKGSHTCSPEFLNIFSAFAEECKTQNLTFYSLDIPLDIEECEIPRFFSRDEKRGPHNDGQHDCILFQPPHEYGYGPPSAMSSVQMAYCIEDYDTQVIDPLLTHSQSMNAKAIRDAKNDDMWKANDDFPWKYIGIEDEGGGSDIEWHEAEGYQDVPEHYLEDTRDVMGRHFYISRS